MPSLSLKNSLNSASGVQSAVVRGDRTTQDDNAQWAILGGVRFVLAFIVLVSHVRGIVGRTDLIYRSVDIFGSTAAVAAFFIISGYSIANSLERQPAHFYARRFWRIYPTYVAAFIFCWLIFVVFGSSYADGTIAIKQPTIWNALGILVCLQGICVPLFEVNSPIWSISIEEIYYALSPLLYRLRSRTIGILVAGSAVIYATGFRPHHAEYAREYGGFTALAWSWLWLLGFEYYRSKRIWHWVLLLLPVALICLNNEQGGILAPFTLSAVALIMIQAPKIQLQNELVRRILNYLGDLSYPLYLIHAPLMFVVWITTHSKLTLVYVAAALLMSAFVLAVVDKPLRPSWKSTMNLNSAPVLAIFSLLITSIGLVLYAEFRQYRLEQESRIHRIIQQDYDDLIAAEQSYNYKHYYQTACGYLAPDWTISNARGHRENRESFLRNYASSLAVHERFLGAAFKVEDVHLVGLNEAVDKSVYMSLTTHTDKPSVPGPNNQIHRYGEWVEMKTRWANDGNGWKARSTRMRSEYRTIDSRPY